VALPERGEAVAISTGGDSSLPARVIEASADSLLVATLLPAPSFSAHELETMVLLFNNPKGRIRLTGEFSLVDPGKGDLLRLSGPRSVEVLQEREYVRIKSARPVLVYRVGDQMEVPSYTVDLSGGGLLLAGPDTLKAGDELQITLTVKPGEPPITGTGRVVRKDSSGRGAVAFEQISELDRRRLVHFIFDCQRIERQRGLREEESSG
jgi:hypothetical protein